MEGADLVWRPPVPIFAASKKAIEAHNDRLKPHLCVLLVSCRVLRLSMETTFTAACLLHRYALIVSEIDNDVEFRWKIMCLVFISCKSLEEHRRLRDLINLANMLDASKTQVPPESTKDDSSPHSVESRLPLTWNPVPPKLDEDYWKAKEYIVKAEQAVLRQLGFDILVSQPHRLVVLLVQDCFPDVDPMTHKSWIDGTWTLLNSCIFSVTALQQSTLALAVAALDMAVSQNKITSEKVVPNDWWKDTGVSPGERHRVIQVLRAVQKP